MRGGAPPFELNDGVCRPETRAKLNPEMSHTTVSALASWLRPLSSNSHEPPAEGANEADGPLSAACGYHLKGFFEGGTP
jgi:hypothetical protein